jgi:pimeloyl-ACP methyl ester carboxylesterase
LTEENFRLVHFSGLHLQCTLRLPQKRDLHDLVIVAPGFLGFKDWGFFPYLSERLCHSGFAALSFNHSLCGVKQDDLDITDREAFSQNSTTQELKDWELLLDSILLARFPSADRVRINAFGIVGHSRGGSLGILMACRVPQIHSVVTWGAVQTFQRYDPEVVRHWRASGVLEVSKNQRGESLKLRIGALEALERNVERLDVMRAMRSIHIPVLLLHGREDKRVPWEESQKLWQCADTRLSRLRIIESAGHTFRTQHPFSHPSAPLIEAITETLCWFKSTLR